MAALSSWNQGSSVCSWAGVRCNRQGRVSVLDVQNLNLAGQISPDIGNLSALQSIYLQKNRFIGNIPDQLGRLSLLETLNGSSNHFSGSIPSGLTNCTHLVTLDLSANSITGMIPISFHSLQNLKMLKLGQNQLTGAIPPSLGNMSQLTTLDASTNTIAGEIPKELGHLRHLQYFDLSINNLTGTVPRQLYNISNLAFFAVAMNKLHGEIPNDISLGLPKLHIFIVCYNKLTGHIPPSLHNITKIHSIRISHNFLTGKVPPGLQRLSKLVWYNIGFNQIVHTTSILDDLTNSTKLEYLGIYENQIVGKIPDSIGNLSSSLENLYIGGNRITGHIPPMIGRLTRLTLLNMTDNLLDGEIPLEISYLKDLNALGLSGNNLPGPIPTQFGNLTALTMLDISKNRLAGSIPKELGHLSHILSLDLSCNNLNGSIPDTVFSLTSLSSILNMSYNALTGVIPEGIGRLGNIVAIDLSYNLLDGSIPTSIGKCQSIQSLSMCGNAISGVIPREIKNLKGLQILDLSNNRLVGGIPEGLEKLQALQKLNLSFNDLKGLVPSGGIFKNSSAVDIHGNAELYNMESTGFRSYSKHHRKLVVVLAVPIASTVTLLIFVGVMFMLWKSKCLRIDVTKVGTVIDDSILKRKLYPLVSYEELFHATENFNERNLVGIGSFSSVYKAVLHETSPFAVKVLDLNKIGATNSWVAECEILSTIRHRNLVKLVTLCSSIDFTGNEFRALVYEFMTNGSLEDWIHGPRRHEDSERGLSAVEVLSIAIDIASALEYMHDGSCRAGQVVHCDIKPSNVLLDGDMTAKIGDFGLARLHTQTCVRDEESVSTTHNMKGTIGYIPPEYGYGAKTSTSGDVYSYGIMLLEMITGKSPVDQMFGGEMNLEKWARVSIPHQADEVVDKRFMIKAGSGESSADGQQQQQVDTVDSKLLLETILVPMVDVALCCVRESPDSRISMHDALSRLKRINEKFLKSLAVSTP
ncbi:putative receptor-like protein kinase At3g47110 [Oryza glaberrima]|uniref:Receptor kinase-like protein Xa21 n=1 Tax=Oryza glaberrima TaxID=4538 RepID=I1PIS5_ORYGL|nr:putative receptor-like protein kinase At3g47110 [Oryza glaberrima]